MEKFKFYQPTKIHFGAGALNQLGTVVKKHGDNCLLVTTEAGDMGPLYDRVKALLKEAVGAPLAEVVLIHRMRGEGH